MCLDAAFAARHCAFAARASCPAALNAGLLRAANSWQSASVSGVLNRLVTREETLLRLFARISRNICPV